MLNHFTELFGVLARNAGDAETEQAMFNIVAVWVGALVLSWGETDGARYTRPLFERHGKTLALMMFGALEHAKLELGFQR